MKTEAIQNSIDAARGFIQPSNPQLTRALVELNACEKSLHQLRWGDVVQSALLVEHLCTSGECLEGARIAQEISTIAAAP